MSGHDESLLRLLAYDRRRYWLVDGWCVRFRIREAPITEQRPYGVRYALTLHDVDMTRLLGFDNAHGIPRRRAFDHRHRFRRTEDLVPYDYRDADTLLCDFFDAVERACAAEGKAFAFESEAIELEDITEDPDDEDVPESPA
jgi:hypothetical protein